VFTAVGRQCVNNEELHDVYFLPITQLSKPRKMRWAGHMARMGRREVHTGFWWEKPDRKRSHGRHRHGWILKWVFKK